MSKVNTVHGTFWKEDTGEDLTFQEALDEASKCCSGISCCERVLRLQDKVTDGFSELYVENDVLKIDIAGTTYTVGLTAE